MVRYLDPDGSEALSEKLDGYGISLIVVDVVYTMCLYASCIFLWTYRHHPTVKMRNVPLLLLSLLVLHVFCFLAIIGYIFHGSFPCQVEFWSMSIYFPIGIGLFQAQNQQILIVSRHQARLTGTDEIYKPFLPKTRRGEGGPKYWLFRTKIWWRNIGKERKYRGFILAGFVVQFVVSLIIYNISRNFNHYGVVSEFVSSAECRRGWEWAPSIIWQFLWIYCFGPYLVWKIHLIRDIYRWRLQTIIAIISGLPGTPLWLAATYSETFKPVNQYWPPGMWFVPGIMTMEVVALGFPIYQILKHKRASSDFARALVDFSHKQFVIHDASTISQSAKDHSTTPRPGKLYSMESLEVALATKKDHLQAYASCMELNGENITFLKRVLDFTQACQETFNQSCESNTEFTYARRAMFRLGLSIFVGLVHADTARYPINIESPIYHRLETIFGPATALVATKKSNPGPSISIPTSASVTPWDDQIGQGDQNEGASNADENSLHMHPILSSDHAKGSESSEHIVNTNHARDENDSAAMDADPLQNVGVPVEFDERVFEAAFKSVKYMVWTGTWQRYQAWKNSAGSPSIGVAV